MKKATDIIVKARTANGAETTDHYSMMGFTKAYNTAKNLQLNEENYFSLFGRIRYICDFKMVTRNYKPK